MPGRVINIERVSSRGGVTEEPVVTSKGYQLADPAHSKQKHHAKHATYVRTLDEAAVLTAKGYSLWMGARGKRPSLIAPKSLRILREPAQASAGGTPFYCRA
jgi:hypothetical protein